jgi:CTP:molybdopterin cytidylyltransferase MocA
MRVDVAILAGAENTGRLAEVSDAKYEATVEIGGKPMVEWVLDGVLSAKSVDRVVIVGPSDALQPIVDRKNIGHRVLLVERSGNMIDNLMAGLNEIADDRKAMIVAGDALFIKGESLDGFVAMCERDPAEVHYAVVAREAIEAEFPGVERTYVKLADGMVTGGNVFVVDPPSVRKNQAIIRKALDMRKNPVALGSLLGLPIIVKYLFGRLSIADAERRVWNKLRLRGRGVIVPYADIGVDIDKPSDVELALRMLA